MIRNPKGISIDPADYVPDEDECELSEEELERHEAQMEDAHIAHAEYMDYLRDER